MKRYIILMLAGISACFSNKVQAQVRAFVQEDIVKVPGVTTSSQVFTLGAAEKNTSRVYVDGLGRPIQNVAVGASPNQKDIIQPMAYDALGRQTVSYLPYTSTTASGAYRDNAITEQGAFYSTTGQKHATDAAPYAQQVFDNSPLQRLLRQGSVGSGFQPTEHYKSYEQRTNLITEGVRHWTAEGSFIGNYADGTLNVSVGTDEEGSQTIVYTDNNGKTILKRQYLNEGGTTYTDTYYVYNDVGQVVYAIPPKAIKVMEAAGNYSLSQPAVDKLLFKYVYDFKGRQIERTVPGGGVAYLIYDPLDRLVLAQDANLRTANKWNYIKYDSRGVAISQGIYVDASHTGRTAMQDYVNGLSFTNYFEERNSDVNTGYYTNVAFPTANIEPLAYSYFDDYDLDGNGTPDYSYQSQGLIGEATATDRTRGMATMVRKRTVGNGLNMWLISVVFYDKRGNTIQTQGNNQLNGNVASSQTMVPDFTGKTIRTKSIQAAGGTTTVYSEFTYDHVGRVKTVDEKYNTASFIRIAAYEYNELGQLVDKKLHLANPNQSLPANLVLDQNNSVANGSTSSVKATNSITIADGFVAAQGSVFSAGIASNNYLQSVDYRYTIRGQLSSINNSTLSVGDDNDDTNDVFGMNILYHTADAGVGNTAYYNGLVSAVKWKTNAPSVTTANERSYKFAYDRLMRLKSANYADRSGTGSWSNAGAFDEKDISYDENGNILALKRNVALSGVPTAVDDLNYNYDGNKLDNVTDGTGGSYGLFGFKNLTGSVSAYSYDANGNLATDPKKGLVLSYNILNRTERIVITTATNRYIDYTYTADGVLLRKQAYDNGNLTKVTDYIGGFVYENGALVYFAMAEGRVRNNSGTLVNEYIIKDQQGNARVSFEDNGGVALVRQENSYYPFGLSMPGNVLPTAANKKLYNGGSEWQDDFADLPDLQQTFYRMYDAALGRFVGVDPVAEASESFNTYHYAGNNPILFNDPLGDQMAPVTGTYGGMHGGYGRIGAGSGQAWYDGIRDMNDWNVWDGSASFREGLARGFEYNNGSLYTRESDGSKLKMESVGGVLGHYETLSNGLGADYIYMGSELGYQRGPNIGGKRVFIPSESNLNKFFSETWKDIGFYANDLLKVFLNKSTTLATSEGYNLARTTVFVGPLVTTGSTKVLGAISKGASKVAKAAPWVAGATIGIDMVVNKQINAGHVYQAVVTGLSFIPGAGLIVGGTALLLEGVSFLATGKSVSDNINASLNGGVIVDFKKKKQ